MTRRKWLSPVGEYTDVPWLHSETAASMLKDPTAGTPELLKQGYLRLTYDDGELGIETDNIDSKLIRDAINKGGLSDDDNLIINDAIYNVGRFMKQRQLLNAIKDLNK